MTPYHAKLCAEVIEQDILLRHTEAVEKVYYRLCHHRRTAHEVDDALWLIVLLEICLIENIVYEACNIRYTSLVCHGIGTVEGEVELEVGELLLNLVVVIEVERLLE